MQSVSFLTIHYTVLQCIINYKDALKSNITHGLRFKTKRSGNFKLKPQTENNYKSFRKLFFVVIYIAWSFLIFHDKKENDYRAKTPRNFVIFSAAWFFGFGNFKIKYPNNDKTKFYEFLKHFVKFRKKIHENSQNLHEIWIPYSGCKP